MKTILSTLLLIGLSITTVGCRTVGDPVIVGVLTLNPKMAIEYAKKGAARDLTGSGMMVGYGPTAKLFCDKGDFDLFLVLPRLWCDEFVDFNTFKYPRRIE
jgi:hypothetical protein